MACTTQVTEMLTDPAAGLAYQAAQVFQQEGIEFDSITSSQVIAQNVAPDLAERTAGVTYPAFYVYCDRITNSLAEKFRTFSGAVRMVIEARVSQDRLESVGGELQSYVEAVTAVLDANRGDLGQGLFFAGGYEVTFGPVKHGGKNYIQTAKVVFDLNVSLN
jgi:hypothetical protein